MSATTLAPPPPAAAALPGAPGISAEPRPHPNLLRYYAITSLAAGPFFWMPLLPLYFRYRSMRYRFDEEGITMRWGVLFRKEISLTYARIQDIHLTSNFVERWLGLARIQIQTASGSAGAEMTIEGLREYEAIRDHLYARMRGTRPQETAAVPAALPAAAGDLAELTDTLRAVAEELRALRSEVEGRRAAEVRDA